LRRIPVRVRSGQGLVGLELNIVIALLRKAGLDDAHQGEAEQSGRSDRHARALADDIACVLQQIVDTARAKTIDQRGNRVRGAMGVSAIFAAEPFVDGAGGVVNNFGKIAERSRCLFLAGIGELADLVGRLAFQIVDLAANLLDHFAKRPIHHARRTRRSFRCRRTCAGAGAATTGASATKAAAGPASATSGTAAARGEAAVPSPEPPIKPPLPVVPSRRRSRRCRPEWCRQRGAAEAAADARPSARSVLAPAPAPVSIAPLMMWSVPSGSCWSRGGMNCPPYK
jgi:hypothetical protein